MSRASDITEFNESEIRPFFATELYFDTGIERFWTGYGTIQIDSESYVGSGRSISFSSIEEDNQISAKGMQIVISGLPTSTLDFALREDYQFRKATVHVGAILSDGSIQSNIIFSGYMSHMNITQASDSITIAIAIENRLAGLERKNVYHYTDQEQKRISKLLEPFHNPGGLSNPSDNEDTSLERIVQIQDTQVVWKPDS